MLTEQVCSICLNALPQENARLSCSHTFCFECIEFWAQSSSKCPYCRKEYDQITKHNG
jgi:late competence protein required for DNA uptake (superfamily II DNA/RNA helicase)